MEKRLDAMLTLRITEEDLRYIRAAFPDPEELRYILVTQALLKLGLLEKRITIRESVVDDAEL